jgi:hypothetical protein
VFCEAEVSFKVSVLKSMVGYTWYKYRLEEKVIRSSRTSAEAVGIVITRDEASMMGWDGRSNEGDVIKWRKRL